MTLESKTANMRKCLTKFSWLFEFGAVLYFPQASLHCCGLLVSSPRLCFSSGCRLQKTYRNIYTSCAYPSVRVHHQFSKMMIFAKHKVHVDSSFSQLARKVCCRMVKAWAACCSDAGVCPSCVLTSANLHGCRFSFLDVDCFSWWKIHRFFSWDEDANYSLDSHMVVNLGIRFFKVSVARSRT